ncbi:MAG: glycosyltransferase family 39 protein [Candidatus Omnitrophica bacterium]|nr:glycosyltransferase family 39 protein [Candidatus Omnitrophota bacterium]
MNTLRVVKDFIKDNNLIFVLMVLSFCLRIIPISWGVPIGLYSKRFHPDEVKLYTTIINFPSVYLETSQFPAYGTTMQYIVGMVMLPIKFIVVKILSARDYYKLIAIIMGRLASVIFGTGSLYLVYILGKKLFSPMTGIIAAAFLSCSFYHVLNSPLCTVDITMGFFLLLTFISFIHLYNKKSIGSSLIFGMCIGLLMGTKITSGMFVAPACIFFLLPAFRKDGFNQIVFFRQLKLICISLLVGGIVFILFHPHIFRDISGYVGFYTREKIHWVDRYRSLGVNVICQWYEETRIAVGLYVTVLAFIGLFYSIRGARPHAFLLVVFLIAYYMFWRYFTVARYIATIAPFLCLIAAYTCCQFIGSKHVFMKIAGWSFVFLTICSSIYSCVSGIYLRLHDTRITASQYIEETIPAGTTVGVGSVSEQYTWKTHAWRMPKFDFNRYIEKNLLEYPDIIIMRQDDIDKVTESIKDNKVNEDYVLDDKYANEWYRYSCPTPEIFMFYDDVFMKKDSPYEVVKRFYIHVNVPLEFPPPEILIYKKKQLVPDTNDNIL